MEQERADKSKTSENELRNKILDLDDKFKQQKEKLFNITTEMNNQYKQTQDELLKQINELKGNVKKKIEIIGLWVYIINICLHKEQKENFIKQSTNEYEQKLSRKEEEIADLKKKIDDMSNEFARMLRVIFIIWLNKLGRKLLIKCKKG